MKNVYLVGIGYHEGPYLMHICDDYTLALYLWNKIRVEEMAYAEESYVYECGGDTGNKFAFPWLDKMSALSITDPKDRGKYYDPDGVPFIKEFPVTALWDFNRRCRNEQSA